jgi:ribokinase
VGGDADGAAYRSRLEEAGIDTTGLVTVKRSLTGTALIGVDAGGENLIMVAPEANGKVSSTQIRRHRTLIESAGVLLMQFEVPEAAVLEAGRIANRARVPVVINPSPFSETFPWGRIRIDCVIANETEAFRLFGMRAGSIRRSKGRWISAMNARGIDSIVLTRGSASTWHLTACGGLTEVATRAVRPVDTVGAGDAFAGAYVAFRTAGESLVRSLQAGNCCGALATLKAGAQEALPTRQELLRAMQSPAG